MLLHQSTWQEVDQYLKTSTGVIIPIGSTEQHGPNGLIGTDAICPEIIAKKVAESIQVLIAPTINFGMAQHHLSFPGTISLRPSTLIQVIKDIVDSLELHGFQHIYFLNGHGGNSNAISASFSEVYAETSFKRNVETSVRCKLMNWWAVPGMSALSKSLFGDAEGSHATPSEISLSYFAFPEAVKNVEINPVLAKSGEFYDAKHFKQQFPDGRIGSNPSLANIEAGEKILNAVTKEIVKDYSNFINLN